MQKIEYDYADRETVIEEITQSGRIIVQDVLINLVDGVYTTCYFMVDDAPAPPPPSEYQQYYNDMQEVITGE